MKKRTCAVVSYGEIHTDKLDHVQRELERETGEALEEGCRTFLTFFDGSVGILFARCVNERRGEYQGIFLESVLHPGHCEQFNESDCKLLLKSNGVKVLCEDCQQEYALNVTRYLVEQSHRVIAVNDGQADTLYAMDYARTMDRDLRVIEI